MSEMLGLDFVVTFYNCVSCLLCLYEMSILYSLIKILYVFRKVYNRILMVIFVLKLFFPGFYLIIHYAAVSFSWSSAPPAGRTAGSPFRPPFHSLLACPLSSTPSQRRTCVWSSSLFLTFAFVGRRGAGCMYLLQMRQPAVLLQSPRPLPEAESPRGGLGCTVPTLCMLQTGLLWPRYGGQFGWM